MWQKRFAAVAIAVNFHNPRWGCPSHAPTNKPFTFEKPLSNSNTQYRPASPEWNHVDKHQPPSGEKVFISTDNPLDPDFPVTAFVAENGFVRADGTAYDNPSIVYWMQIEDGLPLTPPRKGRYQLFSKDHTARFFDALVQCEEIKRRWIKKARTTALNHFDRNFALPENCKGATRCGLTAELPWVEINYWVGDPPPNCEIITLDLMVRCRNSEGEVECMEASECDDTLADPVPTPDEIKERSEIERDREGSQCPYARQKRLIGKRVLTPFNVSGNGLNEEDLS